jgi:uncharacterized protein (DUF2267 family)
MSATGLETFDKTLQTTHLWLDEIMETLGPDRQVAWHALGAVMRTLRDRMTVELAAHMGAQLPLLVRGLYYDQWKPSAVPKKWRTRDEFLETVSAELSGIRPVNPEQAAKAVFQVLNHYMDPGQVAKVREALPEPVRQMWPGAGDGRMRRSAVSQEQQVGREA